MQVAFPLGMNGRETLFRAEHNMDVQAAVGRRHTKPSATPAGVEIRTSHDYPVVARWRSHHPLPYESPPATSPPALHDMLVRGNASVLEPCELAHRPAERRVIAKQHQRPSEKLRVLAFV